VRALIRISSTHQRTAAFYSDLICKEKSWQPGTLSLRNFQQFELDKERDAALNLVHAEICSFSSTFVRYLLYVAHLFRACPILSTPSRPSFESWLSTSAQWRICIPRQIHEECCSRSGTLGSPHYLLRILIGPFTSTAELSLNCLALKSSVFATT
jgi:hypothetical protein